MKIILWQCREHGVQPTYERSVNEVKRCILCGGLLDAVDPRRREEEIQKVHEEAK